MKFQTLRHQFPGIAVGMIALSVSVNSLAQDAVDTDVSESARTLEEIVVTARRQEESMQEVPVAVSVLSGKDLLEAGGMKIDAVSKVAPNVHFEAGGNTSGVKSPQIYIRGVGQADFIGVEDPSVGLYVDGVYLGRNIGNVMDLVDIDRVEVLRGPQGTLWRQYGGWGHQYRLSYTGG